MSDGALSQQEIDALLSGAGGGGGSAGGGGDGGAIDPAAVGVFLSGNTQALSSNLSMMTGSKVNFSGPQAVSATRNDFLAKLPETVTVVEANFTQGFPGQHLFILGSETAKAIASLMNKEENIELDDMAMSVLGEVVSQIVGTEITALTQKTGNKSIASSSPKAANVPKQTAAIPPDPFLTASYSLDLGDGVNHDIWEVFGADAARDIGNALRAPQGAAGGGGAPGGGGGGYQAGGFAGGGMPQGASVHPVQYPNLMSQIGARETGNIGLLMDVFMEMTVELGRTKKSIKEILAMGEGTIIELDKLAGEPVDILVNHKLIAKGEVVVIDENFGVRVTEIVSLLERMRV